MRRGSGGLLISRRVITGGGQVEAFLDQEQERYRDQLERYADIIRRIDDRPVRVGLYFPLLKGWREWTPLTKEDS